MRKKDIIARLVFAGIGECEASAEARILIEELFGLSAAGQLMHPEADFSSPALDSALFRRERREPLAYILGAAFFCDERYGVTPDCLIPRPETELVVRTAAKLLPEGARFADIGCGSGCISVSLLCRRRDLWGCAADISPAALELAKGNAFLNGVADRLSFAELNALKEVPLPGGGYDAIISNPPYIRSCVIDGLEPELYFEPRIALDGGEDGLLFYRAIVSGYEKQLKPDGFFIFEFGFDQKETLSRIAQKKGYSCDTLRDYSGNDRAAVLRRL